MTIDTYDIEVVLGRALTVAENARVDRLIELAEGLVESALPGFSIGVGDETATVAVNQPNVLWTPRYPVTAVTTVMAGGSGLDSFEWDDKGCVVFPYRGVDATRYDLDLWSGASFVDVTYEFGLDPVPADVAMVVASMVAAALRRQLNIDGVQSESLGAYQVSYGDWAVREAAAGMTFPEGALRRWKRNRYVSVPFGPISIGTRTPTASS